MSADDTSSALADHYARQNLEAPGSLDHFGWPGLAKQIDINCFKTDPSVKSSLKFLRKTPWAREKVESLYLFMLRDMRRAEQGF